MLRPQTKGLCFTTNNGNTYYYNDYDGTVSLTNPDTDILTPDTSHLMDIDAETLFRDKGSFIREIKSYLESKGYKQLILIITEDCNLRCRYCVYSGAYENMRQHQQTYMSVDVAREALKRYFEGFNLTKKVNPFRTPTIGFYGGEPLLNFDLIVEIVEIAKKLYHRKISFNLTTNGTILSEKMIDFFHDNDFSLGISLNGPQGEHDRLRIFPDGAGTFNRVWDNIQVMREKYPGYFRQRCGILACYDVGTDIIKTTEFFENYKHHLPPLVRVSPIAPYFTDWYSRYTDQEKKDFDHALNACKREVISCLAKGARPPVYLSTLFLPAYRLIIMRPQNITFRPRFHPYTLACVPGEKIAVDPYGSFHCCEKINSKFPIGDIETGLSISKVLKMFELYYQEVCAECGNCPITRFCPICWAVAGGNTRFERNPPNICSIARKRVKEQFTELWTWFEEGLKESCILKASGNTFWTRGELIEGKVFLS